MSSEIKKRIELEIVHVLFLDIVGYSKLRTNEQRASVDKLNEIVRSSDEFRRAEGADRLIKIPTGDGMALVFYKSPEQPVECALEISRAVKTHPELRVRMGVHSGPVSAVIDVNERANAAGVGMNMAQRVMDCGDAGHILLSKRVAEDLEQYGDWQTQLHDLGEVEVKHGVRVHVFNLYTEELGNPEMPGKLRSVPAASKRDRAVAVLPFRAPPRRPNSLPFPTASLPTSPPGWLASPNFKVVSGSTHGLTESSPTVTQDLGVRYLLRGQLRSAGRALRVNVQLVDARSGDHLWAETYNRNLEDASIFEIQDDLTDKIVGTVADGSGVLARSIAAELRSRPDEELTADDWVFRTLAFMQQYHPEEHAILRDGLERMVDREPDDAQASAWLAFMYLTEYMHLLNPREKPLERALRAAQHAVDLDPACQAAWNHLAVAYYFLRDMAGFEAAAQRAISLNPRNTATVAYMGMLISWSGDYERGNQLSLQARSMNPHHPGWYYFSTFYYLYHREDYEAALAVAKKINMPEFYWTHVVTAAVCGQLGRPDEGRASIQALRNMKVDPIEHARAEFTKWIFDVELIEHVLQGLRKAGLGENKEEAAGLNRPLA